MGPVKELTKADGEGGAGREFVSKGATVHIILVRMKRRMSRGRTIYCITSGSKNKPNTGRKSQLGRGTPNPHSP